MSEEEGENENEEEKKVRREEEEQNEQLFFESLNPPLPELAMIELHNRFQSVWSISIGMDSKYWYLEFLFWVAQLISLVIKICNQRFKTKYANQRFITKCARLNKFEDCCYVF